MVYTGIDTSGHVITVLVMVYTGINSSAHVITVLVKVYTGIHFSAHAITLLVVCINKNLASLLLIIVLIEYFVKPFNFSV